MLIARGNALKMGCDKTGRSYNFAFASESDKASLLIYDSKRNLKHRIDMDISFKTGNVFACSLSGENLDKALYCYEVDGKCVVDPYAKTVTDCENFGVEKESALYLSRVVLDDFDWGDDKPLNLAYEDCIFYKVHVRGFTKSRTSGVKNKGTFAGLIQKIPYLKELGITTLELMPAYEFDELMRFEQFQKATGQGLYASLPVKTPINYWGYTQGLHFAPKAAFTSCIRTRSDYTTEFKQLVKELHSNGIEVVMEMYFNDETPDLILDCIKYWVTEYHIDGVHLYGPVTALQTAAADPVLANTKIITVYWDGNKGSRKHMANYNDTFLRTIRCFLKGDENQLERFVNVTKSNPLHSANINYVTNHNGFTMYDLVSYDRKHNEANGENNKDGESFNYSWNCGMEGKTRKKKIASLRQKQIKNAFMMLLLSAGTPLIMSGDEFENSQEGNNNPYCIDDETSWVNWKNDAAALEIKEFVKVLIAFRKQHRILHMPNQLMSSDPISCGFPDISYHGSNAWYQVMENFNRHIAVMYCTRYDGAKDKEYELIYAAYNMHWEQHELALPNLPEGANWELVMCSGSAGDVAVNDNKTVSITPRTTAVLISRIVPLSEDKTQKSKKTDVKSSAGIKSKNAKVSR